jgi:predicted DNA-binding protein with PD1-like motif
LSTGRTFGVVFDDGEDFYTSLAEFCRTNNIRHGYVPMFIAGLKDVDLVGSCEKVENPDAPVWSRVHLETTEAFGGGTLAYDPETDTVSPHVHISVGLKTHSASGYTSHLLAATVQFLTELYVVEVTSPAMTRPRQQHMYDVPLLTFA